MVFIVDVIVQGVSAFVELVFGVVETMIHGISQLLRKPPEGQLRFGLKNLSAAFAPLAVLAIIVGVGLWIAGRRNQAFHERLDQTKTSVDGLVRRLAAGFDKDHKNGEPQIGEANVLDGWGNALEVSFERGAVSAKITVTSRGADEEAGTWDDVQSVQICMLNKREIAGNAIEKLEERVKGHDEQ